MQSLRKTRDEGHDYQTAAGKAMEKCTVCGRGRTHDSIGAMTSPKNLVIVAMYPVQGEIESDDGAIVNKAAALASYAVSNEFRLSPSFSSLYKRYANLGGVDQVMFGRDVEPHTDCVKWIASKTGESEEQIEALAGQRLFEMTGREQIKDGVWSRFCVVSYFFIP